MNMKKIVFILITVMFFIQCKKDNASVQNTIEVTDALGRKVKVPENITRIVAVNAGAMRFVSYIGAIPLVVGIEEKETRATRPYNFAFPEIRKITIIGPQPGGDAELIMKSKAQVVFWTASANGTPDDFQKKTGIPVVVIENGELGIENDKIFNSLKIIGKVLKKEKRAEELIAYMETEMKELQSLTKDIPESKKPTTYAGGLSFNGAHGIVSTRANFTPFLLVNAKNVVSEMNNGVLNTKPIMIDLEKLMQWNPDYIFIDSEGWKMAQSELKVGTPLHKNLSAIKNNKVYIIPRYINNSFSYDYIFIDAWYIAKTLYPEKFIAVDIEKKSTEILEKFYEKKINLKDFDLEYRNLKTEDFK